MVGVKHIWTDEQVKFIKNNFYSMTNRKLAKKLKLTLTLVRTKCYELGLKRMEMEYWTDEQVLYLKKNYKTVGDVELAESFNKKWKKNKGWTKKHIEKKRRYLGLKRTEQQRLKIFFRNKNAGRFRFCVVNRWITTGVMPEGTIRIWKNSHGANQFKVIKVNGVYVHYAQWLYRQHFGEMKPGHIVGFKDRDNMNVVIDNLEQITRAEHARRNRTGNRKYPDELREALSALKTLNRIIKQKSQ